MARFDSSATTVAATIRFSAVHFFLYEIFFYLFRLKLYSLHAPIWVCSILANVFNITSKSSTVHRSLLMRIKRFNCVGKWSNQRLHCVLLYRYYFVCKFDIYYFFYGACCFFFFLPVFLSVRSSVSLQSTNINKPFFLTMPIYQLYSSYCEFISYYSRIIRHLAVNIVFFVTSQITFTPTNREASIRIVEKRKKLKCANCKCCVLGAYKKITHIHAHSRAYSPIIMYKPKKKESCCFK